MTALRVWVPVDLRLFLFMLSGVYAYEVHDGWLRHVWALQ